jgi:hypothetical protein
MRRTDDKEVVKQKRIEAGKRLLEILDELGVKLPELAKMLKMQYETLRSYTKGRAEPGVIFFQEVQELYPNIDIGYIITGTRTTMAKPVVPSVRTIPIVDFIPPEGFPNGVPKELIIGQTFTNNLTDPNMFALKVHGMNFLPEVREADELFLIPTDTIRNGSVHAVYADQPELELARLYKNESGMVRILPIQTGGKSRTVAENEIRLIYWVTHFSRDSL